MHRRALLKSAGILAGAFAGSGILAACGDAEGQPGAEPTQEPDSAPGTSRVETSAGEEQTLTVISASFETLAGTDRRFAFGVATADNVPLKDADLDVLLRDLEGNELAGPFPAEFVDGQGPLGVYLTRIDVPEPGQLIVAVSDGEHIGEVAVNVVDPDDSQLPVPGEQAIVTPTPTREDDMGLSELCTQQPQDCGMHATSLEEAVAAGRPVALMFATPAYCQTAVCGPAVERLDAVRTDGEWGDVAFVHVEIYSDEGTTTTQPVQAWELPTEPWLFTIGRDGAIVDRIDGIMIESELRDLVSAIA